MPSMTFDDVTGRLAQALLGADAGAWVDLDQHIRADLRWGDRIPPVHTWFPAAVERGLTAPEVAVALCGPDGRAREAALPHVSRSPELLPLAVIRCADWAEPVRVRALAVLRAELPGLAPEALDRLTAVALRTGERLRGGAARELLTASLREGPTAVTAALLDSGDRAVRRLAHRVAVERGLLSPARLAAIAAVGPDVVVQDLCANAALATAGDSVDDTVLAPLLGSRLGRARAAGVTALHRAGRSEESEPFLYDRSALVRACARWVLRQAGTDPVPLYRAACAAGDAVPSDAPLGLAECGDRATDGAVLWKLTEHGRPQVRASAVAGLRVLDAVRVERLAPLLADDSPRVVREAARALAPWADHFPTDALRWPPVGSAAAHEDHESRTRDGGHEGVDGTARDDEATPRREAAPPPADAPRPPARAWAPRIRQALGFGPGRNHRRPTGA
ncbi:hypothetical protein [Streptomyces sp. NBC_00572]|uniref:hypothetical protein n=1 Tax=Streptomyces sp. NBC_00572 TaxID=2903664 RepID=UPI002255D6C4|nr:hypothetical protein [Streptomyces sp. NBC_00572]MCX4979776.1 hypothetical protein [Streptomyces sp. NBC_00572]